MKKLEIADIWENRGFIITNNSVKKFNSAFKLEERYTEDEKILNDIVPKLIKPDSSLSDIYQVVTLINSFYSTRMGADICYKMALVLHENNKKIIDCVLNKNIDKAQEIIEIFRKKSIGRKKKELESDQFSGVNFSFLTKYFSIVSRYKFEKDNFPIYDGIVARVLTYNTKKSFTKYGENKDYKSYTNEIGNLINGKYLEYKELDDYLWNIGRKIEDIMNLNIKSKSKRISSRTNPEEIKNSIITIIEH
ncbi:MAG TPA: hypothetical protein PKJ33_03000 [Alphaproteobacteria bacterium]|nr:hypothetical protein [Alphaproteobacteria bacterium]